MKFCLAIFLLGCTPKQLHVLAFLNHMKENFCGDDIVTENGATEGGEFRDTKILPYESIRQVYAEYQVRCDTEGTIPDSRAGSATFR